MRTTVEVANKMDSSRGTVGYGEPGRKRRHRVCLEEESEMKSTTIAVDLAKSVFEVAVSDRPGRVKERRRLSRSGIASFLADQEATTVVMEACGSAHYWGRYCEAHGHRAVLLPPQYVRPYVIRNKTDRRDAKALLEAYRNEAIEPVPVKSVDQQAIAALHALRSAWMVTRTARLNTLRGILREFGIFIPVGAHHVARRVREVVDEGLVPPSLELGLERVLTEVDALEDRIRDVERQLEALVNEMPVARRLMTVPGVGLLTATALVARFGDAKRFRSCRRFASAIGITPRERSSGSTRRLGRISKQGDAYVRMLLIHGARSVLWAAKRAKHPDPLRQWALRVEARRGHNKAAVAIANKMARIVWSVWSREHDYRTFSAQESV